MTVTDLSKQHTVITEQDNSSPGDTTARRRRTDQHPADTAHIIPFPAEPALKPRPATETSGPQIYSLPLRKALYGAMEPLLRRARAASEHAACLVLELDSYREIEETYGHQLAEELGSLVEQRLIESLRDEDVVYQVAHNEFVILLDRLEQRDEVAHIAERLLAHCTGSYHIAEMRLAMKGRIGMALYPTDTDEPDTLLRYARVALREACPQRGEHCQFFNTGQLLSLIHISEPTRLQ